MSIDKMDLTNNSFYRIIKNENYDNNEDNSNENIILNNIISNASISNNDTENNLHNNTLNNSIDFKNIHKNSDSFILLLYKELITVLDSSKINNFESEYNKIKNVLKEDNSNSVESIINIFIKSFQKIITEKIKELLDNINELNLYILLLQQSNRYHIKQNFLKQTKIDILENEIDSYIEMEEEYEEMKEKYRYENGKFLNNERKENEILILRAENSNLKKKIDENEKSIEKKDQIIESFKKKSSSMINTNNNTIKNSFDFNEKDNPSSIILIQKNKKLSKKKIHQNNSNMTNFKSLHIVQKIKSHNSKNKENNNKSINNLQNSNLKKMNIVEINNNISINNCLNNKKISLGRGSTKDLLSKRIKNKVLNVKKIRRINESCLENYNKSYGRITNSIMSNNSYNNNNKRLKKKITSFYKKNKNNEFPGIMRIHKKISPGKTNTNIKNLIKNNTHKIIVNSILEQNNNNYNLNNNSFLFKTSRKTFGVIKKSSKTNVKHSKEDYLLIRNNNSLIKSPTTFNSNDIENSLGMKNNIIINNIIQNSTSLPISGTTSRSKEKKSPENDQIPNIKNNNYSSIYVSKKEKGKSLNHLSVNVKRKKQ